MFTIDLIGKIEKSNWNLNWTVVSLRMRTKAQQRQKSEPRKHLVKDKLSKYCITCGGAWGIWLKCEFANLIIKFMCRFSIAWSVNLFAKVIFESICLADYVEMASSFKRVKSERGRWTWSTFIVFLLLCFYFSDLKHMTHLWNVSKNKNGSGKQGIDEFFCNNYTKNCQMFRVINVSLLIWCTWWKKENTLAVFNFWFFIEME